MVIKDLTTSNKNQTTLPLFQKWYDNEWGYSNKVIDLICYIASITTAAV